MNKASRTFNTLKRGFAALGKGMASIADGMGRITIFPPPTRDYSDIYAAYMKDSPYKQPPSAAEALAGDWQRVGDDMRRAMDKVAAEHNLKPPAKD